MLLHSAIGAQAAVELAARSDVAHLFDSTVFYCLSPRIAEAISGHDTVHAAEPTEDTLLKLLRNGY